jgi:large subunit ribosomal protein L29
MTVIRLNELRSMTGDALKAKLEEIELEIGRELGSIKRMGKPANPGKYKEMRKVVARIKTILHERELRKKTAPAPKTPATTG